MFVPGLARVVTVGSLIVVDAEGNSSRKLSATMPNASKAFLLCQLAIGAHNAATVGSSLRILEVTPLIPVSGSPRLITSLYLQASYPGEPWIRYMLVTMSE